jgi:hypothetical protein
MNRADAQYTFVRRMSVTRHGSDAYNSSHLEAKIGKTVVPGHPRQKVILISTPPQQTSQVW